MSAVLIVALFLFQNAEPTKEPVSFKVRHEHTLGACEGTLTFSPDGVRYETKEKNHSRKWSYPDVKYFEIISEREIEIRTYESQGVARLGRDRDYDFRLTAGALTDDLYQTLVQHSPRAVVTHVVFHGTEIVQEIPVRHRHRIGGCAGTLTIATDKVIYRAEQKEDSRIWRLEDIQSFASSDPFSLRLSSAFETFTFDLKLPLEQNSYDLLWRPSTCRRFKHTRGE
jgi:hypothetical protein